MIAPARKRCCVCRDKIVILSASEGPRLRGVDQRFVRCVTQTLIVRSLTSVRDERKKMGGASRCSSRNRDGVVPQADHLAIDRKTPRTFKRLIISDLGLCFSGWHGHCNRDCRNEKTFESIER